jgi:hypothetical protein
MVFEFGFSLFSLLVLLIVIVGSMFRERNMNRELWRLRRALAAAQEELQRATGIAGGEPSSNHPGAPVRAPLKPKPNLRSGAVALPEPEPEESSNVSARSTLVQPRPGAHSTAQDWEDPAVYYSPETDIPF